MKQGKETALVKSCLQYLQAKGIICWRNNSGMRIGEHKGKKWAIRFGQPGSADILGILPPDGRLVAVECKIGKNEPTELQLDWLQRVAGAGGLALVVYSLDELMEAI